MAKFFFFNPQILNVALMRGHLNWPSFHDFNAIAFQTSDLLGIISQQAYSCDAQVAENLGANAIVTQILFKAQVEIGFNGIESLILQRVRADLISEPNPTPFLMQIDEDPLTLLGNHSHGLF